VLDRARCLERAAPRRPLKMNFGTEKRPRNSSRHASASRR